MSKMSELSIEMQNALAEFETRLKYFDWNYEYTDSHNIYRKWRNEEIELQEIAKKGPEFAELYEKYKNGK